MYLLYARYVCVCLASQASDITNGIYLHAPEPRALLQYLLVGQIGLVGAGVHACVCVCVLCVCVSF